VSVMLVFNTWELLPVQFFTEIVGGCGLLHHEITFLNTFSLDCPINQPLLNRQTVPFITLWSKHIYHSKVLTNKKRRYIKISKNQKFNLQIVGQKYVILQLTSKYRASLLTNSKSNGRSTSVRSPSPNGSIDFSLVSFTTARRPTSPDIIYILVLLLPYINCRCH
jgi:hypothetical protein